MIVESRMDEPRDQFPAGLRVLAVDDDPTCLRLLETLLRRCRYHVTTTNQALTALKLLRENKDMFDLVISDVHMPDMDGFKLLELVGLEMDLPVIMLSANGDTKLVMQGVTHGACDYLVKPVRIEELKNIWQHVIRRIKFDTNDQNGAGNQDRPHEVSRLSGLVSGGKGDSERNGKAIKRRKDQNEDEDDKQENGHDNDETTTQKKPRVVWSVELHHKFLAAVRQLGIDKAVPKKILDLMNVEKLTRENVASHLQKYRLYLKRISCQQNQQANMVAALGGADPCYLSMGSLNRLVPLQNMTGSGHFQNPISGSFSPVGMLGGLNTPSDMGINGLPSPGLVQLGQSNNSSNLMTEQLEFQHVLLPRNLNGSMIQGTPVSLELNQLHQNGGATSAEDLQLAVNNNKVVYANCFPDSKGAINSCNPLLGVTNNALMLESQEARLGKTYENRSAVLVGLLPSEFSSSLMLDPVPGRCNEGWSSAVQSSTSSDSFRPNTMHSQDNLSSKPFQIGNPQFQDSLREMNYHQVKSAPHILTNAPKQEWDDHKWDVPCNSNVLGRSVNSDSPANGGFYQLNQNADPKNSSFNVVRSNFDISLSMNNDYLRNPIRETTMTLNQGYNMDQYKAQHSCDSNNSGGSLEDLVTAMMKQEQDKVNPVGEDFVCDIHSIESCM